MSMNFADRKPKVYDDGKTVQTFKDDADINRLLAKGYRRDTLSHLQKYEPVYADYAGFDFETHHNKLIEGTRIFNEAPAEVRKEFDQSPAKFFAWVNDPQNAGQLSKKLPALAMPGRQMLDASSRTPPQTSSATTQAAQAAPNPPPQADEPEAAEPPVEAQ